MKKSLKMFISLTLSICLFVGLSQVRTDAQSPVSEDMVIFNWDTLLEPKSLDPALVMASDAGDVVNHTFEGLVREKSGIVYPGIAKSWEVSEDGLTVTFHLRESKWSDGSPLTANDFVYAWKRSMNPETRAEYAWIWEYTNIKGAYEAVYSGGALDEVGIRAVDEDTLVIELNTPTDYLVSLLSFWHFLPVKQEVVEGNRASFFEKIVSLFDGRLNKENDAEKKDWSKDVNTAISNGPFVLTGYEKGRSFTLTKNENYWDADNIAIDIMNVVFTNNVMTAYQAYEDGVLLAIPEFPSTEVKRLIKEDPNFYTFPLLGIYYYNMNMDFSLWEDPRVRRALNLGIDREIIAEALGSEQIPATGFIPEGFLDHKGEDFAKNAGDFGIPTDGSGIKEAQELLAEAGYPNGQGFPEFTLIYNTGEGHQIIAELVQEMYKNNLGINVELKSQEWVKFQNTREAGDYEMARGGWLTDFMDPIGLLAIFAQDNYYNDPNYSNEAFDELMAKANGSRGEEHYNYLYQAYDILMNDLPVIPIYYYTDTWLISDKVKGWDRSVLGTIDFTRATIDQ